MSNSNERTSKPGLLPPTDWSQIRRLKAAPATEQQPLLDVLAKKYWTPIFQYLLCQGHAEQEAQDLIQDFFVFALQTRLFEKADEERGRFRNFLLGSLNHFVANERRKQSAQKRKPKQGVGSLDELMDDGYYHPKSLVNSETPEVLFHRAWVREVVRNVLAVMEKDFKNTGKTTHFILFQSRVVSPELDGDEPPPLQQQARELGLEYKEAANQIIAAKRAFRRLVEREVRSYVRSDDDMVQERLDVLRLVKLEGGL
jgi:RNA polymerase sigma-70 factor (ECF subfamily)